MEKTVDIFSTMATKSFKIRDADHSAAKEHASRFGSNSTEVVTAWRFSYERLPKRDQLKTLLDVRRQFPAPYPRTGRGNRRLAQPA